MLIFLKEKDKKEKDKDVGVYFIEAKMEPFLHSSPPVESKGDAFYQKNASSVLHELFLKVNLVGALHHPEEWLPGNLVDGVENVYADDKKDVRKIGKDPLVLELARRLHRFVGSGGEPYYVSLTTDSDTRRSYDVMELVGDIVRLNGHLKQLALNEKFQNRLLLLSWQDIFRFVASAKCLARACHQLERNVPKFVFPPLADDALASKARNILKQFIESIVERANGKLPAYAKPARETKVSVRENGQFTVSVGGRALFRVSTSHGLDGPLLKLCIKQKDVREALHKNEMTELLQQMWSDKLWVTVSDLEATNGTDEAPPPIREIKKVVEEHLRFLENIRASKNEKP